MKSIESKISALGLPADWTDLPGWECPGGCGEVIRGIGGEPAYRGSIETYATEKCCSRCAPKMIARHMPRAEVLRRAGAPPKVQNHPFDAERSYNVVDGVRADTMPGDPVKGTTLQRWTGEPHMVTLTGRNGRGKSFLAGELVVRLYRLGLTSQLWVRASSLVDEHFARDGDMLKRMSSGVQVLVIDEYGRGTHSNTYAYGVVGVVIDERYSADKPTILTTNLPIVGDASLESHDSAVFDRLASGWLIPMIGPSQR